MLTRETLKSYFESGDKPSQEDFEDLIDSTVIKSDFVYLTEEEFEGLETKDESKVYIIFEED